jgi:hypothetical protein
MKKTKFDLVVEHILNINEGRKPKKYQKMIIDFDKLESDINGLSDKNPFKKLYTFAINGLKHYGKNQYFTNEEMAEDPKTLPEWEDAIFNAFSGASLSRSEKNRFTERFFNFLKDPDREYFSEFVGKTMEPENKTTESVEQHIFDFINQSENESATKQEVIQYANRYGHDEEEAKKTIEKMVNDGSLREDGDNLIAVSEPSIDDLEPSDSELNTSSDDEVDDLEAFRTDIEDASDDDDAFDGGRAKGKIPDDIAQELGINADDPFGDNDMDLDNLNYKD